MPLQALCRSGPVNWRLLRKLYMASSNTAPPARPLRSENFIFRKNDPPPMPATMSLDNIRVYQRPGQINTGCSPEAYPTKEYICAMRSRYTIDPAEDVLLKGCDGGADNGATPEPAMLTSLLALLATGTALLAL